jgi:hypothetical protein
MKNLYNTVPTLMPFSLGYVRFFTGIGCLALSIFAFSNADIVGRDGVLYLQVARVFTEQGFFEAFNVYDWPFYSILIGLVHSILGLSIEYAGYFLNTVLLLVLTDTFVRLYAEINPATKKIWLAAAAILVYAGLNDYRIDIIRGWGSMAFSLLSFLYFIRFCKSSLKSDAILWQVFIMSALVFRIEAVVYMLLVPAWLICFSEKERLKLFLMANSLFILAGSLMLIFIGSVDVIRERVKLYLVHGSNPLDNFSSYVTIFAENVLNRYSENYAFTILASGIAIMVAIKIVTKLGLFFSAVTAVGAVRYGFPKQGQFGFIAFLLTISYLIILMFFSQTLIMTGRYVLLSSLLLLFFSVHYMEEWVNFLSSKQTKAWIYAGFILPMIVMLVSGVIHTSGNSKQYIKDIGIWVKNNIPKEASLLSNDRRLQYYSGRDLVPEVEQIQKADEAFLEQMLERYEYLLLRDTEREKPFQYLVMKGRLSIKKEVSNEKGKRAVLYQVAHAE